MCELSPAQDEGYTALYPDLESNSWEFTICWWTNLIVSLPCCYSLYLIVCNQVPSTFDAHCPACPHLQSSCLFKASAQGMLPVHCCGYLSRRCHGVTEGETRRFVYPQGGDQGTSRDPLLAPSPPPPPITSSPRPVIDTNSPHLL